MRLLLELLEPRRLLSAPTAVEMQMLDAINTARANPTQARAAVGIEAFQPTT